LRTRTIIKVYDSRISKSRSYHRALGRDFSNDLIVVKAFT
jgi:hypothetical protein